MGLGLGLGLGLGFGFGFGFGFGLGLGYLYCGQAHAVGGRLGDDLLREALPLLRALVAGGDLTEGAWLGLG